MSAIETMSDRELLDRYNARRSAFRSYVRSDGDVWNQERRDRESCLAEIELLTGEWQRRHRGT